ncbi:hypothetical protein SAMN05216420_11345 [Nitrosospira sp. Nl5]|nr:hypothetical protein [Nitrosospira sp. Nl5]SCY69469.1 hypothetical protein SAMN05216420_11345 [Nitrosospira sp. Nl5]
MSKQCTTAAYAAVVHCGPGKKIWRRYDYLYMPLFEIDVPAGCQLSLFGN